MPKKSKSAGDEKRKAEQKIFEDACKALRDQYKKSDIIKASRHFDYGKDPQKSNSKLGTRKVLHRLCGCDINNFDKLTDYVSSIKFNYCILAKPELKRCYDMNKYVFKMKHSFNLSEQIIKALTPYSLPNIFENAMINNLVTSKHKDCILKVNDMQFYVRSITQNAMSSDMEARQNEHRVSYGPVIVIEINPYVIMRIRCSRIGVGYYDLVNHKLNKCGYGCIHKVINIHENFLNEVYVDFGLKNNYNGNLSAKIIHNKLFAEYGGSISLINVNEFNSNINTTYGGSHNGFNSNSVRYNPLTVIQSSFHNC